MLVRPSFHDAGRILFAQIAENEARQNLTAPELVHSVSRLIVYGIPQKEIASSLGINASRIARIAALRDLPSDLAPLLETMDVDPLYELLQQFRRSPAAVRQFLTENPAPTRSHSRDDWRGHRD